MLKVGSKTDFRAEIRDVKTFGAKRRVNPGGVEAWGEPRKIKDEEGVVKRVDLPADVLAVTLDSGEMAFLYARHSEEQGQVGFVESRMKIGSRGVHPSHLGKSIAIDPW